MIFGNTTAAKTFVGKCLMKWRLGVSFTMYAPRFLQVMRNFKLYLHSFFYFTLCFLLEMRRRAYCSFPITDDEVEDEIGRCDSGAKGQVGLRRVNCWSEIQQI